MLQSMALQRVGHSSATEQQQIRKGVRVLTLGTGGRGGGTEMLTLEQKRQVREGGLDCLPPLISSHLAGQPWVAPLGTARAKAGQVQGVSVQASRGAGGHGERACQTGLPRRLVGIRQCSARTKAGYWGGEVPRGTHLGCPQ